jgi:hypothetical protein
MPAYHSTSAAEWWDEPHTSASGLLLGIHVQAQKCTIHECGYQMTVPVRPKGGHALTLPVVQCHTHLQANPSLAEKLYQQFRQKKDTLNKVSV